MQDRWEKAEKIVTRLGCMLPLTLWPTLLYYRTLGTYSTGRHSAEALYAIGSPILFLSFLFTLMGVVMVDLGNAPRKVRIRATTFLLLHLFVLFQYIMANAVMYG